jgi:hypothetical protein
MTPSERIRMFGQMVNHAVMGDMRSATAELPDDWGPLVLAALAEDLDDLAEKVCELAKERA